MIFADMDINIEKIGQVTIVAMSGELDSTTALSVQDQIFPLAEHGGKILLDMTNVTYMSSAGLRFLLLLYRRMRDNIGHVALAGLSEEVEDTMSITGFLDFFSTFENRVAGVKALKGA